MASKRTQVPARGKVVEPEDGASGLERLQQHYAKTNAPPGERDPRHDRMQAILVEHLDLFTLIDVLTKQVGKAAMAHREPSLVALHDVLHAGLHAFVANADGNDEGGLNDLYGSARDYLMANEHDHAGLPHFEFLTACPLTCEGSARDEALFLIDHVALPITERCAARIAAGESVSRTFYREAAEALASALFESLTRGVVHLWARVEEGEEDLSDAARDRAALDIEKRLSASDDSDPTRWTSVIGAKSLPPLAVAAALRAMGIGPTEANRLTERK